MSKINIYRIDESKHRLFTDNMNEKLSNCNQVRINEEQQNFLDSDMVFTLYKSAARENKNVSWEWILSLFEEDIFQINPQPKAVVVLEYIDEMYAVTFGHAYFLVDKYCDRDFAFSFARKINFKEIKTTALTSPNSQRNKTVNTYIDYSNLEFDSGESFTKLKAKVQQEDDFDLYSELIEVGNSLKFTLSESSFESIGRLVIHINEVLEGEDIYKIPVFTRVTDKVLIEELDNNLKEKIRQEETRINISEIDIIGATEIFNNNDTTFTLRYNYKEKHVSTLSQESIEEFANENGFDMREILLEIKVISHYNDSPVRTEKIRNLIDEINDEKRCILSKGEWYHFNDDYQKYLEDSISELNTFYEPKFDFTKELHEEFLTEKFSKEKDFEAYRGLTEEEIKKKIKTKYYAERTFNLLREEEDGFQNHDREETRIGNSKVELMDLYKDETMFAVKIGNSSSKLCYAIDQSISSLRLYKHNSLEGMPKVEKVAIWLIFERDTKLSLINGKPDINGLEMLMLKNKIDIWKKEVRLLGFQPVIYINYRKK